MKKRIILFILSAVFIVTICIFSLGLYERPIAQAVVSNHGIGLRNLLPVTYAHESDNYLWKNFALKFYNKELPKYLPKYVKFKVVVANDGKGIAIHMITPEWYTQKDTEELNIIENTLYEKCNEEWRKINGNTTNFDASCEQSEHDKLSGTDYYYYAYQTALGTSMDTDVYLYECPSYEKIAMQGTAMVWIIQPMEGYRGLTTVSKLHAWGVSVSLGFPPSGTVKESVTTFRDSCPAPYTRDIYNFPTWIGYAFAFSRAGQDQIGYVHYVFGGTWMTDHAQLYRGITF